MTAPGREDLRALVRDAIREALTEARRAPPSGAAEPVRITNDADLALFVQRLARLMADPASAARVASGAHRFTLTGTEAAAAEAPQLRETGIVTEKAVAALPEGAVLRLAPGAVVTPLARDRARARRVTLERTR